MRGTGGQVSGRFNRALRGVEWDPEGWPLENPGGRVIRFRAFDWTRQRAAFEE